MKAREDNGVDRLRFVSGVRRDLFAARTVVGDSGAPAASGESCDLEFLDTKGVTS
jgi:hypothetical protein